jgi:hypothetical protein
MFITLKETNSNEILELLKRNQEWYLISNGCIQSHKIEANKIVYLVNKTSDNKYNPIYINIRSILRFKYKYEIGDVIAKLLLFINTKFSINLNIITIHNKFDKTIDPFKSIQECSEEDDKGLKITFHFKKVNEMNADDWFHMFPIISFDLVDINLT